jgi:hypothetical protein
VKTLGDAIWRIPHGKCFCHSSFANSLERVSCWTFVQGTTHAVTEPSSNLLLPRTERMCGKARQSACLARERSGLFSIQSHMQRRASPILDTQGVEVRVGIRADRPVSSTPPELTHWTWLRGGGRWARPRVEAKGWSGTPPRGDHRYGVGVGLRPASSRQQNNARQSGKAIKIIGWGGDAVGPSQPETGYHEPLILVKKTEQEPLCSSRRPCTKRSWSNNCMPTNKEFAPRLHLEPISFFLCKIVVQTYSNATLKRNIRKLTCSSSHKITLTNFQTEEFKILSHTKY